MTTTKQQEPIYEDVVREQGWSPDDLGVKFDVERAIAASYGIAGRQAQAAKSRKRKPRK